MRCKTCGTHIERPPQRNPKLYCSNACTQAARRKRDKALEELHPLPAKPCRCDVPIPVADPDDGDLGCLRCGHALERTVPKVRAA